MEATSGLDRLRGRTFPRLDLLLAGSLALLVLIGHWKLIFLNHQPVGGDKTSFFYGLMAHYGERLKAGELPWWCPIWGEGFPMVAESQIGAFYPPHLILYRWLAPIDAYRLDFLLHRLALGPSVYFAMRYLRLGPFGSWVAGLALTLGGFPTNHYDHQWAVCSLPWLAWLPALSWRLLTRPRKGAAIALPAVLAMVLLVGHFQTTFMTLVAVALLIIGRVLRATRSSGLLTATVRGVMVLCLIGIGFLLAGIQLVPTARFIRDIRVLGSTMDQADFRGTHAQPVWMQTALFAPALHFREPFWREPWWTTQRTAPEECLHYIGLLPAVLALGTFPMIRRRAFVWCWWLVWLAAINFAAGRWLPWNYFLEALPGFGWFRCPARWILIQEMAAAVLAGYAADRVRSVTTLRRVAWRGLLAAVFVFTLWGSLWSIGYGLSSKGRAAIAQTNDLKWEWVVSPIQQASFLIGQKLSMDAYTRRQWRELALDPDRTRGVVDALPNILLSEVGPTILVGVISLLALGVALRSSQGVRLNVTRRRVMLTLGVLVTADLAFFQGMFPDRSVSRSALEPKGKLADDLRKLSSGSRVLGPGGNFLMSMGLAPANAYRTVDTMASPYLTGARWPGSNGFTLPGAAGEFLLAAAGVKAGISGPPPNGPAPQGGTDWVDAWLYGSTPANDPGGVESIAPPDRRVDLIPNPKPGVGGFYVPESATTVIPALTSSEILEISWSTGSAPSGENLVKKVVWKGNRVTVTHAARGSGAMVLAAPAFPGWKPVVPRDTHTGPFLRPGADVALVTRFLGGWMAFEAQRWTPGESEFEYYPPGALEGCFASAAGVTFWIIGCLLAAVRDPHWADPI